MNTDTLIDQLAANPGRVSRHAINRRLLCGLLVGAGFALLVVASNLGIRGDLDVAVRGSAFWIKWAYTISLGVAAVAEVRRLASPEPVSLRGFWLVAIPVVLLAVLAIAELGQAPLQEWPAMWLGQTWRKCPWLVLMLSAPIFMGLLWSFRTLAPTRLRAAGAAAGFASGACAATVYGLHCPEVSALFVLTWYSLGILLATAAGAVLGPRVLRW